MIDKIFFGIVGCFSSILAFFIVAAMVGFILILPFLLKGGWLLGLFIYGYPALMLICWLCSDKELEKKESERNGNRK